MPTPLPSKLAPGSPVRRSEVSRDEGALIAPHLYPGEVVLHCVHGVERPLWALAFLAFAFLFHRRYLIVATERRLLLIVHKTRFGDPSEASIASVHWRELELAELAGTSFWQTLRISAHGGRWRHAIRVRPNFAAHEGIVAVWKRKKQLQQLQSGESSDLARAGARPARSRTR